MKSFVIGDLLFERGGLLSVAKKELCIVGIAHITARMSMVALENKAKVALIPSIIMPNCEQQRAARCMRGTPRVMWPWGVGRGGGERADVTAQRRNM